MIIIIIYIHNLVIKNSEFGLWFIHFRYCAENLNVCLDHQKRIFSKIFLFWWFFLTENLLVFWIIFKVNPLHNKAYNGWCNICITLFCNSNSHKNILGVICDQFMSNWVKTQKNNKLFFSGLTTKREGVKRPEPLTKKNIFITSSEKMEGKKLTTKS